MREGGDENRKGRKGKGRIGGEVDWAGRSGVGDCAAARASMRGRLGRAGWPSCLVVR